MCDFVRISVFVLRKIFHYSIESYTSLPSLVIEFNKIMPGCTTVFLFGRLETCLENSLLKQFCTVVVFYIHMYVAYRTFDF